MTEQQAADNENRAQRALDAINHWKTYTPDEVPPPIDSSDVVDLMADLLHMLQARRKQQVLAHHAFDVIRQFDEMYDTAQRHFIKESLGK